MDIVDMVKRKLIVKEIPQFPIFALASVSRRAAIGVTGIASVQPVLLVVPRDEPVDFVVLWLCNDELQ